MVDYGRLVARLAPRAWLINFSNPVSIVTQAVHQETDARLIGICDTPMEMFEDAAHALGLPPGACSYDYFGLNHLGWLRDVVFEGEGRLHRIWNDDEKLLSAYRSPLFEPERLRQLKLLPTEYLYYYYRPEIALANMKRSGSSRGQHVAKLTEALFADLRHVAPADPRALDRYQHYLAERDGSYMTARDRRHDPARQARLGGAVRLRSHRADDDARHRARTRARSFRSTSPTTARFPSSTTTTSSKCRAASTRTGPRPQAVAPIPDRTAGADRTGESLRTRHGERRAHRQTASDSSKRSL